MRALDVVSVEPEIEARIADIPEPEPGPHDLLVKVAAAGLNWVDLRARAYNYGFERQGRAARVPGIEMAGAVVATGTAVEGFSVGDRVMGMTGAAAAEYALLDHRLALRVPDSLDIAHAGGFSVSGLTAHDALVTNGDIHAGQSVLVHAALSGVGVAALQIAALKGSRPVIGTASSQAKLELAREFGLNVGIDYRTRSIADAVMEATDGQGADVILDLVGGGVLTENMNACALGGRIIGIGRFGGRTDTIDLDLLALRRIHLIGVTFRTRNLEQHAAVVERFAQDMGAVVERRQLRILLQPENLLPLAEGGEGLRRIKARSALGKVILLP